MPGSRHATYFPAVITAGRPWRTETVDAAGNVGFYKALAYDASGNPAMGYSDNGNDDVKFTRWNGQGWTTQIVDNTRGVDLGIDLAYDPATAQSTMVYGSGKLKFSRWTGSTWTIQTIENRDAGGDVNSLAYNPLTKRAGVSYVYTTSKTSSLRLAQWTGSAWQIQTVDANTGARYSSLAYNPLTGHPAIAYSHDTSGDGQLDTLKFAEWNGSRWNIQSLEVGPAGYGVMASLAFDASGNAVIVHGRIRMLRRSAATGAWAAEALVSGSNPSLAIAPSGDAYVSYSSGSTLSLLRVGADGSRETQAVSTASISWITSLAFDSAGEPSIGYCEDSTRDLKFAGKSTSKPGASAAPAGASIAAAPASSDASQLMHGVSAPISTADKPLTVVRSWDRVADDLAVSITRKVAHELLYDAAGRT